MSVEEIFHQALAQPPAERPAFLATACAGDEPLQRRVQALLYAHDNPGSFLAQQPPKPVGTTDDPISERPGTVIGPYKLLELIGEGGMGAVWMAQQTEPIQRRVAVKVVKEGMDSRQVLARFEAERQALALMDHPNIAKVLDAGRTPSGRPYFAMELVKGKPITTYCDEKRLGVRERLELFGDVCRAVQHAHQKGIIHRDLKPSNVLVAPYDGKPVVKVIDFGVAKATGQQLTEKTIFTGFGALVGTPEYMSPEQAEVNNQDIDTRSDIYSLGVLLYELLTGSTPLTRQRMKEAALLEVLRLIREEDPPRPSTRLSTTEELPSVAANRGLEPKKLSGLVRGELDWIAMKALEKDRNRRYETANGLAMDVQRYLHDEPVLACPPSAWYRFCKFARRNKGRLAAAAVLGVALLATAGSIGWVARNREARQARLTGQVEAILEDEVVRLEQEQKWPEALAALERAEAVLAGGEVGGALQRRLDDTRRDLVFIAELDHIREERAVYVEGKFNDAGAVRHYAEAFRTYGLDVEALSAEETAAWLQGKPAMAVAIAAALDDWVHARRNLGNAEPSWKPLVAVARRLDTDPLRDRLRAVWGQPRTPDLQAELRRLAESINVKAHRPGTLHVLAQTLDRVQLADASLRILQDGRQAYPADFWVNYYLAFQLYARKDYVGALRYYSTAVSIRPDSSAARNNLGNVLGNQGKQDEAVAEYRLAIALDPKNFSPHYNLGYVLGNQGKRDEAIACYRKAIEAAPKYAPAHNNLGNVLRDQGKRDEAIACYRKAIEADPKYALFHVNLGRALSDQGKWDEAIACFKKAIEINPNYVLAHNELGNVLGNQGKLDEAIACYRKAIEIDPKNVPAHISLGDILNRQGKPDEAIASFKKAIEIDPYHSSVHVNLGNTLSDQGKRDEAAAEFRKAIDLDPKSAYPHYIFGLTLERQGKLDEAIACYQKAIELDPKGHGAPYQLALIYARLGRWDQAAAPMDKAAELAPDDVWRLYLAAALQLQVGDLAGYRRNCRAMLARSGDTKDPGVADRTAKSCLLMPDAVTDLDRVQKLADQAVTGTENNADYRWFLFCKALAEYRAGRHAEAVQWLERVTSEANEYSARDASAFAVRALAQHHRSQGEEALRALDRAERIIAEKMHDPAAGRPFGDDWQDWLHCQALLREAEALLKPDEARIHFYRGLRRRSQDKWPEAEAEYRQAIRLRPNWYEAHYQLAVAIEEQGRQKDAQAAYRQALRFKPKPPDGPPRSPFVTPWSDSEQWVIKNQEVHNLGDSDAHIFFGDPDWTDYDFEAEVEIIAGGSEVGLILRATDRDDYLYSVLGAWNNTAHGVLIHCHNGNIPCIGSAKGQSKKGCWYRLRVEARGERVKVFLDSKLLITVDAGERLRGCVGLIAYHAHTRFRNLKVTDVFGKVLLEGVKDVLPKPKA
jgi:tetratricopeptide (TPR) repeat protein